MQQTDDSTERESHLKETEPMWIHHYPLKTGITGTPEFEKKRLATHAVNVGTKCGHNCLYCSTGAVLRTHPCFKACGENPFAFGYAVVDPSTPDRVARDAKRMGGRGLIQLCTLTDMWVPEAQEHLLGRRCLEAILSQPEWTVRILTKNAAIRDDFDIIEEHRNRVLIGLSITAPLYNGTGVLVCGSARRLWSKTVALQKPRRSDAFAREPTGRSTWPT